MPLLLYANAVNNIQLPTVLLLDLLISNVSKEMNIVYIIVQTYLQKIKKNHHDMHLIGIRYTD